MCVSQTVFGAIYIFLVNNTALCFLFGSCYKLFL